MQPALVKSIVDEINADLIGELDLTLPTAIAASELATNPLGIFVGRDNVGLNFEISLDYGQIAAHTLRFYDR